MPGSSHRADHPVNPWSSLLARFVPDRADPAPLHWVAVRSLTRTEAGWQTAQQSPPCLPELTSVGFAGVPVFELRSGLICIHQGRERERGGGGGGGRAVRSAVHPSPLLLLQCSCPDQTATKTLSLPSPQVSHGAFSAQEGQWAQSPPPKAGQSL